MTKLLRNILRTHTKTVLLRGHLENTKLGKTKGTGNRRSGFSLSNRRETFQSSIRDGTILLVYIPTSVPLSDVSLKTNNNSDQH